jgi:hypothetical protein
MRAILPPIIEANRSGISLYRLIGSVKTENGIWGHHTIRSKLHAKPNIH